MTMNAARMKPALPYQALINAGQQGCRQDECCTVGKVVETTWRHVHVGDIVEVHDNEDFPADLLCLYCQLDDGVCYIKTTNLDGMLPFPSTKLLLNAAQPMGWYSVDYQAHHQWVGCQMSMEIAGPAEQRCAYLYPWSFSHAF